MTNTEYGGLHVKSCTRQDFNAWSSDNAPRIILGSLSDIRVRAIASACAGLYVQTSAPYSVLKRKVPRYN